MWDYDIAIVGGTPAGLRAARYAVQWGARVALVGPQIEAAAAAAAVWDAVDCPRGGDKKQPDWDALALQARVGKQALVRLADDPAALAIAGVDWLPENDGVAFGPTGLQGGLQVGRRSVRAQRYLLAPPIRPRLPAITGLAVAGYCDATSWLPRVTASGRQWTVLGADAEAIAWAQRLARWGKSVTLVVSAAQLLPGWIDCEVAVALQRLLEAEGLCVLLETEVCEVRSRAGGGQEIVSPTGTWLADEIFIADGARPDFGSLNLDAVGVTARAGELPLDRQLRAPNRRIFVCRTWLGDALACQDAEIAANNALFGRLPWRRRSTLPPHALPRLLRLQPGLAALGLTEAQAQQRWPGRVRATTRYLSLQARYVLDDATSGLCKIVARHDGRLLGVQLLAAGADDLLAIAALARAQQLTVADLSQLAVSPLSRASALVATARQWLQTYHSLQPGRPSHWLRWQRRWLP